CVPTSLTAPAATPSSLSVLSLITSTGVTRDGASSCTPPESVRISIELATNFVNSSYLSGSVKTILSIPCTSWTKTSLTAGFRCNGRIKLTLGCSFASIRMAPPMTFSQPRYQRRCVVTTTFFAFASTNFSRIGFEKSASQPATSSKASITVLPVTKMSSGQIPSDSKFFEVDSVGAKCREATLLMMLRFTSSGNGENLSPVRKPASRCTTLIPLCNSASAEAIAVEVSPCTSSTSGETLSRTGSNPVNVRETNPFSPCPTFVSPKSKAGTI